jgi:uncharacterized protein YjiS (DUF1127 family)
MLALGANGWSARSKTCAPPVSHQTRYAPRDVKPWTETSFMTFSQRGPSLSETTRFSRKPAPVSRGARLACSIGWLLHLACTAVTRRLRTARQRRQLAQLDDWQLRDAGIDPALAGRGKAIAVDMAAHVRLQSLGVG